MSADKDGLGLLERTLDEMNAMNEIVTHETLYGGRRPSREERDVERAIKNSIRSWIKPLRRSAKALKKALKERDRMLYDIVRIGNWCAQDLCENAYVSEGSGNYLKTLNGLCAICRPYMKKAREGGKYV